MSSSCANSHQFNASISKLTRTNNPTLPISPFHHPLSHYITPDWCWCNSPDDDGTMQGLATLNSSHSHCTQICARLSPPPGFVGQFMLESGRVGGRTHTHINGCIKFQNTFTFIRYTVLPHSHSFGEGVGRAGNGSSGNHVEWNTLSSPALSSPGQVIEEAFLIIVIIAHATRTLYVCVRMCVQCLPIFHFALVRYALLTSLLNLREVVFCWVGW